MILIADSGSTKTDWALIDDNTKAVSHYSTSGLNPVVLGDKKVQEILVEELLPQISDRNEIDSVRFYGAGCTKAKIPDVECIFGLLFPNASSIQVASDMLGAAIAACKSEKGIVAILGTGSNSCLFDGEKIIQNTPSLGYILGDEGSGAVLGKLFLNGILKRTLPETLCNKFFAETGLTQDIIINKVYHTEAPNRFLASLSPYIHDNLDIQEVHELVVNNFRAFFRNNITQYNHPELPVNFVGSMGFHYIQELREAAQIEGFIIGNLVKSPIEGLIENIIR